MKRDSKLSLALHALGHMATGPDKPMPSEDLARIGPTNPVVVRRVLGLLRDTGIVSSAKGHDGGWRLAKPAASITVADVYRALGEGLDPARGSGPENPPTCAIERALHGHWDAAVAAAEAALIDRLSKVTIADLAGHYSDALSAAGAHPGHSTG
jgi:Rrf2 family protein